VPEGVVGTIYKIYSFGKVRVKVPSTHRVLSMSFSFIADTDVGMRWLEIGCTPGVQEDETCKKLMSSSGSEVIGIIGSSVSITIANNTVPSGPIAL